MLNQVKSGAQRIWFALLCMMLAGATTFACGGAEEGFDEGGNAGVGQAQEALTGFSTNSFGYGITTGSNHTACLGANAPSGQQCLVPVSRTIRWCVFTQTPSHDALYAADMNAIIAGIGVGWTFVHLQDGNPCNAALAAGGNKVDILINEFSAACSGGSTNANIDAFACGNPTVGAPLSESLPGSYLALDGNVIHLDTDDIHARAVAIGPASQVSLIETRLRRHGLGHQLAFLLGCGARTDTGAGNSYTRRAVLPVMGAPALTIGEKCRANHFNEVGPTTYALSTGSCQTD